MDISKKKANIIKAIKFPLLHRLYTHRRYIAYNAWYELRFRYAGTGIGMFWNLIHPLAEITLYTLVFSLLIGRGMREESYTLYLTSGLLPWKTFADAIFQGSNAFLQNTIYLKRLAIPAEIFVAKIAVTSLFLLFLYLIFIIPLSYFFGGEMGWSLLGLPILAAFLHGLGLGMALVLANLQVLFPDVRQILQVFMPLWSWTMPIIYPEQIIPTNLKPFLYFNPPYAFLESIRHVILDDHLPSIEVWGIMLGWLLLFLGLGALVNDKLKDEVKDVL
ncbi:ABC transporter permease [Spirulina sp. CS-785/01]|uniref:ABC transporter permease n=1 Tax=Spirulina sp. CS-785/01 TaxID=3021716 RepID=UPI00232B6C1F|nr:ABC transporter permease [Spirulina sp. CS-785/01]MDB9315646.1 ABC transporter permease [Spirulina sp. CS-785/01]